VIAVSQSDDSFPAKLSRSSRSCDFGYLPETLSLAPSLQQQPVMKTVLDHTTSAFPLARLALCLDCEMCFDLALNACPACASATSVPVSRFLERPAPANN